MSDNDGSRIDAGRLFQTRGPLTANDFNDRSPNVVLVDGTTKCDAVFIERKDSTTIDWKKSYK